MDIAYLRSFCAAVKFKNISKAAEYLHLSQPGLSMQLHRLEDELNVKFLTRSNKGVRLTKEGSVVYEYANDILSLSDKMECELKKMRSAKSVLSICACESICANELYNGIYSFKELYPDIDISVEINPFKDITGKLLGHDANFAILIKEGIPERITTYPILHDRLILVGPNSFKEESVSLDELARLPLILREDGSGVLSVLTDALSKKSLAIDSLNVVLLLNSTDMIKSSIVSGKGFSFLPLTFLKRELSDGMVKKIMVKGLEIPFDYCIAFRDSYTLTKTEKKFLDFFTLDNYNF